MPSKSDVGCDLCTRSSFGQFSCHFPHLSTSLCKWILQNACRRLAFRILADPEEEISRAKYMNAFYTVWMPQLRCDEKCLLKLILNEKKMMKKNNAKEWFYLFLPSLFFSSLLVYLIIVSWWAFLRILPLGTSRLEKLNAKTATCPHIGAR